MTLVPSRPRSSMLAQTAAPSGRTWCVSLGLAQAEVVPLTSDNTPPKLSLESQPPSVLQGHTWLLRIRTNEPASVQARLGDQGLPVEAGPGDAVTGATINAQQGAIAGISVNTAQAGLDGIFETTIHAGTTIGPISAKTRA